MYASEVLPFGSVAINLSPSDPPESWPKLSNLEKGEPVPSQGELDQYLFHIANSDEILLHADGPILRNHTGVCIDLKVILVTLQDSEIDDPEVMFESIGHVRNTDDGIFPLAKWTWPSSFGRWEIDWVSRGYFQPTYCAADLPINSVTQNESSVEYFGGNICNGVWRYWVDQWYPVHRKEVGNSLGTYMTVSKDFFNELKDQVDTNFYLIAEMTCVDRREFNPDKEVIKSYSILPV